MTILDSSKLKDYADGNFEFDENGRKFSKRKKKTQWEKEKLLVTSNFFFSYSVFKKLSLQTREGLKGRMQGFRRRSTFFAEKHVSSKVGLLVAT